MYTISQIIEYLDFLFFTCSVLALALVFVCVCVDVDGCSGLVQRTFRPQKVDNCAPRHRQLAHTTRESLGGAEPKAASADVLSPIVSESETVPPLVGQHTGVSLRIGGK